MEKLSYKSLFIIIVVLLIGIVGLLRIQSRPSPIDAAWYNAGWTSRIKLTIDHTKVSADQTDFPIYIDLTLLPKSFHSTVNQVDGRDIRITKEDGTTELPREIVDYTPTTGKGEIYVKYTGTLSSTTDTIIYLYYGSSDAIDYSTTDTYGRNNVWTNSYGAIWHLRESGNGTSGEFTDSTGTNNGTGGSSAYPMATTNSKLGTGQDFDGTNDIITVADNASLEPASNITVSAWVKFDTLSSTLGHMQQVVRKFNASGTGDDSYAIQLSTANRLIFNLYTSNSGGYVHARTGDNAVVVGAWYHVVGTWTSGSAKIYVNGVDATVYSDNPTGTITYDTGTFRIGAQHNGAGWTDGIIDEPRVESTARSSTWISTQYNNQNSPSTFFLSSFPITQQSAPVAYWKFDENVGTTAHDSSVNRFDGVIETGGTSTTLPSWTIGKYNSALRFDGLGNRVTKSGDNALLRPSNNMSVEAWVYLHALPSEVAGNREVIIIKKHSGSPWESYGLEANYSSSENRFTFSWVNASGTTYNAFTRPTTFTMAKNTWYHVVGVRNEASLKIYVDGLNLTGGSNLPSGGDTVYVSNSDTEIGSDGSTAAFKGVIDEVKLYDYARTDAQIKNDYNNSSSISFGSSNASSLTDGLISYWTLDESASPALDKSGVGYSGAWINSPTSSSGKYGKAISLNGTNQYVSMGDQTLYDLSLPFSLSAWIYMDQLPSVKGSDSEIISKYSGAPNRQWTLAIGTDDGLYFWKSHNGTNGQYSTAHTFTSGDVGKWIHVGFTADANGVTRLFVNGEVVDTGQFNDLTMYSGGSANLIIGARSNPANYFDGKIDEVRIYNKTLSPSQLKSLYQHTPNPIGHWKMEESSWNNNCSTETALDSSGSNHNLKSCPAGTGPTGGSVGKIGKAGTFDGSDDYLESTSTDFNLTGDITLSAWVRPLGTPSGDAFVIDRTNNNNGYSLGWQSTRRPRLRVGNGSSYVELTSANTLNLNTWYHLSATVTSSGVAKIYVNGQLDVGGTGMVVLASTGQNLRIGSRSAVNTVNAQIDDVKIYDYVRSQGQIAEDIGGNNSLSSPLIHLKFDEGYGDTANDSSSNKVGDLGDSTICPGSSTCPSWSTLGKFGKAVSFNGLDNRLFTPLITSNNDNISFSTWVNWAGGDSSDQFIYFNGASSSNGWSFFVNSSNNLSIICENNDTVTSTTQLTPETWQHLVTQRVSGTWEIYLNAKKITLGGGVTCTPSIPTTRSTIGSVVSQNYAFNGLIDEFKAYDFTLSQEQINSLYNSGFSLQSGQNTQTVGVTTTSLQYCIPGDTSPCSPPIGEWLFEQGSGTTTFDTSGNNYHGVFGTGTSAPTWIAGKVGSGLNFNGTTTYADIGDVFYSDVITIEAWVNIRSVNGSVKKSIIEKRNGSGVSASNNEFEIVIRPDRKIEWATWNGNGSGITNTQSDTVLNLNQWYHVAATHAGVGGTAIVYINGVAESYQGIGSTIRNSTSRLQFGPRHANDINRFYDGMLDDVKIYNYVRTPAQIAYDYNKGGPIAWWKFDENSGTTTVNDSSGRGLHASMTNMSLSSWIAGKYNYALDFLSSENDNRVSITDAASGNLLDFNTNSFAISFWVKTSSSTFSYIIQKRLAASGFGGYGINLETTGKVRFGIDENDTSFPGNSVTSNKVVNDNTWHHIVMTKNGITDLNVYVDGILDNTGAVTTSADGSLSNNTTFVIGAESDGTSSEFTGQIDDVRVYNYLPTSTQVKNIMNNGSINFR